MGLSHQPFLKSKLVKVLADSFLRAGSPYKEVYDNYKARYKNDPRQLDEKTARSKMHIEKMARRAMMRIFVIDLWLVWREQEGLPLTCPYEEAKMGVKHSGPRILERIIEREIKYDIPPIANGNNGIRPAA